MILFLYVIPCKLSCDFSKLNNFYIEGILIDLTRHSILSNPLSVGAYVADRNQWDFNVNRSC